MGHTYGRGKKENFCNIVVLEDITDTKDGQTDGQKDRKCMERWLNTQMDRQNEKEEEKMYTPHTNSIIL